MKICKLSPSQRKQGRWLVELESGDVLRVTDAEMVDFALYTGMELSPEALEALKGAAQKTRFKEYALNLLSVGLLSRAELIKKLTAKECPPAEAEAIAQRMTQLGYLNDEQYAKALAAHYAAKGYGPYKIKDELFRRGVGKEHWDGALDALDDATDAVDALLKKKLRGVEQPTAQDLKKAGAALARRGFSWQAVSAALRRYDTQFEED